MKNILYLIVLLATVSCAKYTTPKKVERKLTKGTWYMYEFYENEMSRMDDFKNVSFTFTKDNIVETSSASKVKGTWEVGSPKNPAILYLNFQGQTDNMHFVSDDWIVYKLNSTECVLKRNMGEEVDYDALLDRLILRKIK